MDSWLADLGFERPGALSRAAKAAIVNPLVNYMPAGMLKALLRFGKSELAEANWADPGGWRSMVISYDGRPRQVADKILVGAGTIPMALRNRKRLGSRLLARLIDAAERRPVHVLSLGAGPGQIIIEAMSQAKHEARATLVDLNADAFDFGRRLARQFGLSQNVSFVTGDVRHVEKLVDHQPDIVTMLGICEYLTDDQIVAIVGAAAGVMPAGAPIVFNSISKAHGTDRFFRRVFGLHMNHRRPEELQTLMSAGYANFVSIPEPLGVYHVIVGRRIT